jgi:hypothetical protein
MDERKLYMHTPVLYALQYYCALPFVITAPPASIDEAYCNFF